MDVAEFLELRIREDMEWARACGGEWWRNDHRAVFARGGERIADARSGGIAAHVAQQCPAVALARFEAITAILADYRMVLEQDKKNTEELVRIGRLDPTNRTRTVELRTEGRTITGRVQAMKSTVLHLAGTYRLCWNGAVHPDWQEKWDLENTRNGSTA